MGSFLEGWAFRVEEGERVLNKTQKIKTVFLNTIVITLKRVSEGFKRFQDLEGFRFQEGQGTVSHYSLFERKSP